jgi:AmiR/NasT family two-component response regulator
VTAIRALIVDDHTLFREGLRAIFLTVEDIEVVGEAATGRDAMELAQRLEPDVILMDIQMDDINGDLPQVDVAIVVGANDVVNPAARHDKSSPIYGMPIIDADKCKTVIACR